MKRTAKAGRAKAAAVPVRPASDFATVDGGKGGGGDSRRDLGQYAKVKREYVRGDRPDSGFDHHGNARVANSR